MPAVLSVYVLICIIKCCFKKIEINIKYCDNYKFEAKIIEWKKSNVFYIGYKTKKKIRKDRQKTPQNLDLKIGVKMRYLHTSIHL